MATLGVHFIVGVWLVTTTTCSALVQQSTVTRLPSLKLMTPVAVELSNPIKRMSYCAQSAMGNMAQSFSVSRNHTSCLITPNEDNSTSLVVKESVEWDFYYNIYAGDHLVVVSAGTVYTFKETTSSTNHDMGSVDYVTVVGASMWVLYSRDQFQGKQYLVKEGTWTTFFGFSDSVIRSITRLGDTCANKPIGVQNPLIIPDSAMSVDNAYGGDVTKARLNFADDLAANLDPDENQWGGFGVSATHIWWGGAVRITVNLGSLFRVYGVGTQSIGGINGDGDLVTYHTNQYYIMYTMYSDPTDLSLYQENGETRTFYGRSGEEYKYETYHEFDSPFLARYVATQGVESYVYYSGIRMEFYGCEVEDEKEVTYATQADNACIGDDVTTLQSTTANVAKEHCNRLSDCDAVQFHAAEGNAVLKRQCITYGASGVTVYMKNSMYSEMSSIVFANELSNVDDDDVTTCIIATDHQSTLRLPVPAWLASASVYVTLTTTTATTFCDVTLSVYVHYNSHLMRTSGLFWACTLEEPAESDIFNYQCLCTYGACEYVFITFDYRSTSTGCLELCDIEFAL